MPSNSATPPVVTAPPPQMRQWMAFVERMLNQQGKTFQPTVAIGTPDLAPGAVTFETIGVGALSTAAPGTRPAATLNTFQQVIPLPDYPTIVRTETQTGTQFTVDEALGDLPAYIGVLHVEEYDTSDPTIINTQDPQITLRSRVTPNDNYTEVDIQRRGFFVEVGAHYEPRINLGTTSEKINFAMVTTLDDQYRAALIDVYNTNDSSISDIGDVHLNMDASGGYTGSVQMTAHGQREGFTHDYTYGMLLNNDPAGTGVDGGAHLIARKEGVTGTQQRYAHFGAFSDMMFSGTTDALAFVDSSSKSVLQIAGVDCIWAAVAAPGALPIANVVASAINFTGNLAVTGNITATGTVSSGATITTATVVMSLSPFAAGTGWLLCDGSAVSRTTYSTLFTYLSTRYGPGDGSTTFNLPDFRGRGPMGRLLGDPDFGTLGGTGGAKTVAGAAHTHTESAHTHTETAHVHGLTAAYAKIGIQAASVNVYGLAFTAPSYTPNLGASATASTAATYTTANTRATALGGNTDSGTGTTTGSTTPSGTGSTTPAATSVLQPFMAVDFLIKT